MAIIAVLYFTLNMEKRKENDFYCYFLAFTRTSTATPAIIPPNTNNTKIGKLPDDVSIP